MERTSSDDPFLRPPGIPEHWGLLRSLVQALAGLMLVVGPSMLLNELVGPLWDNVPWSIFATFGLPIAIAAGGVFIRRRWSRVGGTLLVIGASVHFVGWLIVLIYAAWLTRSL